MNVIQGTELLGYTGGRQIVSRGCNPGMHSDQGLTKTEVGITIELEF